MSLEKEITELVDVMAQMRDPEKGCAWTQKQTYQSLTPHTIEEAYEVADTIERGAYSELKGEVADLLNQVIFYSRIAEESGNFDFKGVVQHLKQKLIDRHPDVFAKQNNLSVSDLEKQWETIKKQERVQHNIGNTESILNDIAYNLPALSIAKKLQTRVASVGFDWEKQSEVLTQLKSEVIELEEAFTQNDKMAVLDEVGDVMFSCVNLIRHLREDPEQVMRQSCRKFEGRFRALESILESQNMPVEDANIIQLEEAWTQAKYQCRIK